MDKKVKKFIEERLEENKKQLMNMIEIYYNLGYDFGINAGYMQAQREYNKYGKFLNK
jgi:hypothetical protein